MRAALETSLALATVLASACSRAGTGDAREPAHAPRIAIVAAERGPQGAHLVAIAENGDRQFELLAEPGTVARDTHPAISPDGAWVVFASSRGRALDETSLWIAPLVAGAEPVRLTDGVGIESHPVWKPDGSAIVFASTRAGGDFDLYEVPIVRGTAAGPPIALTGAAGHEVTPAVGRDGAIVFAAITPKGEGGVESRLEVRARDGAVTPVTDGPGDTSPALSPDERTIVFARPVQHSSGIDAELWTMPREGSASSASPLVELPLTDESGPVWSPDGRYVFATSVLRGAEGNVVFSSVIVIDVRERPIRARLLEDRVGPIERLTPAVTRTRLDAAALAADPEYLPELARIMRAEVAKQQRGKSSSP